MLAICGRKYPVLALVKGAGTVVPHEIVKTLSNWSVTIAIQKEKGTAAAAFTRFIAKRKERGVGGTQWA